MWSHPTSYNPIQKPTSFGNPRPNIPLPKTLYMKYLHVSRITSLYTSHNIFLYVLYILYIAVNIIHTSLSTHHTLPLSTYHTLHQKTCRQLYTYIIIYIHVYIYICIYICIYMCEYVHICIYMFISI